MSQSLHRSRAFAEILIVHQQRDDILATPGKMIAETHRRRKIPDYILRARRIGSRNVCLGSEVVAVPERMDYLVGDAVLLRMATVDTENRRGTE
jgi:hypothetical protein